MDVRRAALGCGLALTGLLLAGCRVEGTVEVVSSQELTVDLLLVGADADCEPTVQASRLTYTPTADATGADACRVTGTLPPEEWETLDLVLVDAGEYLVFRTGRTGGRDGWPEGEITFRFAGDVVDASQGTVSGSTVRIPELPALGDGIEVVALKRPGPPDRVLWAAFGAGAGVTLALLAALALRRSGRRRAPGEAGAEVEGELVRAAPLDEPGLGGEPRGPAPTPDGAGTVRTVPPTPDRPDTSWLGMPPDPIAPRAPTDPPGASAGTALRRPSGTGPEVGVPDHSVWAPPPQP